MNGSTNSRVEPPVRDTFSASAQPYFQLLQRQKSDSTSQHKKQADDNLSQNPEFQSMIDKLDAAFISKPQTPQSSLTSDPHDPNCLCPDCTESVTPLTFDHRLIAHRRICFCPQCSQPSRPLLDGEDPNLRCVCRRCPNFPQMCTCWIEGGGPLYFGCLEKKMVRGIWMYELPEPREYDSVVTNPFSGASPPRDSGLPSPTEQQRPKPALRQWDVCVCKTCPIWPQTCACWYWEGRRCCFDCYPEENRW